MTQNGVAVEVTRGGHVESIHAADVAVVVIEPGGEARLAASFGEPEAWVFPRSALKPFQAHASYLCGLARLGLGAGCRSLAIMSASHGATPDQVAAVRELLSLAGVPETALCNGVHPPAAEEGRRALAESGEPVSAVHGNCSGKHAGMLAACAVQGWPTGDYLAYDHPSQQHVRAVLNERFGVAEMPWGWDGCGLPTYAAPLRAFAEAFARLGLEGEELAVVGASMASHPRLIGPPESFNVRLLDAVPGLVAKSGAEAAFGVGVPGKRIGIGVKIRDGNERAVAPVVMSVLRQLGIGGGEELAEPVVYTLAGEPAGGLRAVLELTWD